MQGRMRTVRGTPYALAALVALALAVPEFTAAHGAHRKKQLQTESTAGGEPEAVALEAVPSGKRARLGAEVPEYELDPAGFHFAADEWVMTAHR